MQNVWFSRILNFMLLALIITKIKIISYFKTHFSPDLLDLSFVHQTHSTLWTLLSQLQQLPCPREEDSELISRLNPSNLKIINLTTENIWRRTHSSLVFIVPLLKTHRKLPFFSWWRADLAPMLQSKKNLWECLRRPPLHMKVIQNCDFLRENKTKTIIWN